MSRLIRVTLPVTNLAVAVRFYQRLLGNDGERAGVAWHYFQLGGIVLACYDAVAEGEVAAPALVAPLYIALDELVVQAHMRAQGLGAQHVDPDIGPLPSGESGFGLRDPFGNHLCIVDSRTILWSRQPSASSSRVNTVKLAPVLMFQQEFLNAVKGGELARVKELLALDADLVNVADANGVSALLLAAYKRNERIAAYLLALRETVTIWEAAAMGANGTIGEILDAQPEVVNTPAVDGFLPLGLACFFGHEQTVQLLLERGADARRRSHNRMSAFPINSAMTQAAPERALAIVHLLLRAGAEPGVSQVGGHTPLHQAAGRGMREVVELLVTAGADPVARAANGATAYDLARAAGHVEVMALLERFRTLKRA